ncbi:ABC transporter ATP-binding protein [Sinimarinibacterium sp. CAU 1509]|uniref:ABC transporter ATP-binding protein n=1 Tax=Sinimarinibacterium sp. CAU 1509 TaxID=2562283 RepID=UPI0010ABD429|nr:ABC transporter ATP-binding protein [Sinimarinibacterium sp. CAU 1509]TJY58898.1 ABC transporter ATP-binding protein [Sinimarinibacterium sp. CAU 1509]
MAGNGIRIEGLRKRYGSGDTAVDALKGVDMYVAPGEVVGLIGPSGSGKSTLLKCLGAVIDPTGGRMTLGDEVIYDDGWKVRDLRALRRDKIGFVFQAPYLIPFLDVTDNVALLPMLAGVPNAAARERAVELLTALDVQHRKQAMPAQLSGGEQQRVAIARGLVNHPPVILADEPTAPLDSQRAMAVVQILNEMARKYETAIIVVTHDEKIIPTFKRIYHIRDGVTHEEPGEGKLPGVVGAAFP